MFSTRFLFMTRVPVLMMTMLAVSMPAYAQRGTDDTAAATQIEMPAQEGLEPAENDSEMASTGAGGDVAQTTGSDGLAVETAQIPQQLMADIKAMPSPQEIGVDPDNIDSVLFTFWEQAAIDDAKRSARDGANVRGVTDGDIASAMGREDVQRPKPPPEEREISLGGIVYEGKERWVIWLNGERVQPNAIPEEIIGLKVYKDYIEMKWLDDYTMQVFPIRLRAHQRFNMDARIFLPG